MKLYHGTTVPGLDILRANSRDREGREVLYLTNNFSYSLFYIRDREIDFVTCGVGKDGIVHYDEKFPNQLDVLYRGRSGWVYEVDVEAEPTKINGIFVTRGDAKVLHAHYIPDTLKAIREEIQRGAIDFLTYENTTEEQRKLNQEGIAQLLESDDKMSAQKRAFFQTYFSEILP